MGYRKKLEQPQVTITMNAVGNQQQVMRRLVEQGLLWRVGQTTRPHIYTAPFGIAEIDAVLPGGGLAFGKLHKWVLSHPLAANPTSSIRKSLPAIVSHFPPFLLLMAVLRNLPSTQAPQVQQQKAGHKRIIWLGRRSWPTAQLLYEVQPQGCKHWSEQHLCIDAEKTSERARTAVEVLRNPAVTAVICDADGFDRLTYRRLQYASRRGMTLALLFHGRQTANPYCGLETSWELITHATASDAVCWKLILHMARGVPTQHCWYIELSEDIQHGIYVPRLVNTPVINGRAKEKHCLGGASNLSQADHQDPFLKGGVDNCESRSAASPNAFHAKSA